MFPNPHSYVRTDQTIFGSSLANFLILKDPK